MMKILTKMRKLKTNMRYLMQLRQSPSMVVPRAEASPCPCGNTTAAESNMALGESLIKCVIYYFTSPGLHVQ